MGKTLAGAFSQVTVAAHDWLALAALVFFLGVRHGFDPDHLVAIDGLARSSARLRPRLAGWCGVFFSLGHGVVVTLLGIAVALVVTDWQAPAWLEQTGACVSIGVLAALGAANLLAVARAPSGVPVALAGLRGRWWADRLANASHPAVIAAIGAAFALSFDTISHALLFSLTGASMAGWLFAGLLGVLFTLGMALTDAVNGWWVARLAARADALAAVSSRCMSVAIAALCLLLAAGGFARYVAPSIERFAPAVSVATLAATLVSYLLARRLARSGTSPQ